MLRVFFIVFVFASCPAMAQLSTARLFGNHAVLQREKPLPVWGWAKPGERVEVKLNNSSASAKANASGKWSLVLQPQSAGGPYTLQIKGKTETIRYTDIMIGEVWICSGQSNMEWRLNESQGYAREKKEAEKVPVRQFLVSHELALTPQGKLTGGEWVKATAATVGDFTAVGYFFAKELSTRLGVTVGLINTTWGGSQIESWISKESMLTSDLFKEYANSLPTSWKEADSLKDLAIKRYAFEDRSQEFLTLDQLAARDESYFSNWHAGNLPSSWDWQGKWSAYRGKGFMQRIVTLEAAEAAQPSTLRLGDKDGVLDVVINGKKIVSQDLNKNKIVSLPAGTWKKGNNILLVQIEAQQDPSWYGVGVPGNKDDLYLRFQDTTLHVSDNRWRFMPDFTSTYRFEVSNNRLGTSLYNGMLYPIIPYTMRGVIWYQGESNVGRAFEYRKAFPLLIEDWRQKWKSEFPFLFVQLSSFGSRYGEHGHQNSNGGSGWAELREAQTMALSLPNTGMAVTIDIGDPDDVHPRNKQDVGKRLAANALANVYKITVPFSGPLYNSMQIVNNRISLSFTYADHGFLVKDQYGYIRGFEICGEDAKFVYAQAVIDGNRVVVWNDGIKAPRHVRYAWADAPVEANLYNQEGFPVNPFRTDDFPCVTAGNKFE